MRFRNLLYVPVYSFIVLCCTCFRRAQAIPSFNLRNQFLASFLFLSFAVIPTASNADVLVDLYQCVDSTGSLTNAEFDAQVDGLSDALGTVFDTDLLNEGSVRFTIIRLRGSSGSSTDLLFGPEIMNTAQDVTDAQDSIDISLQSANGTCYAESTVGSTTQRCCMDYAAALAEANPLDQDTPPLRILDMTTDGEPNRGLTNASTMNTRATVNYGFDAVNVMGINLATNAQTFVNNLLANDLGFQIPVDQADNKQEYEDAFSMKIIAETTIGCCVADNMCSEGTEGECMTLQGVFAEDKQCGVDQECAVLPEGCCQVDEQCTEQLTEQECLDIQGAWGGDGVTCGNGACMDPIGCCDGISGQDACVSGDGITREECTTLGGNFSEGDMCNFEETCGDPVVRDGCCELTGGGCDDLNNLECNGKGTFVASEMCNFEGTCGDPIIRDGCCELTGGGCEDLNNVACNGNGRFVEGEMCNFEGGCGDPIVRDGCCELPGDVDSCDDLNNVECNTAGGEFFVGDMCNFEGTCGDPVVRVGCCEIPGDDPSCEDFNNVECNSAGGEFFVGDMCNFEQTCGDPIIRVGCCELPGEDPVCDDLNNVECNSAGGEFFVGDMCNFQGTCGEPIVIDGCCTIDGVCENLNNVECFEAGGKYVENLTCNIDGECAPEPETGCCVCGTQECNITSEKMCEDMGEECEYLGDNVSCRGVDECEDEPGCCFLNPSADAELANRVVDPNKCVEVTNVECGELDGQFQGQGTMCSQYPDECNLVVRNVPTISQWGMIAMAGLLGIFSLIVIARRNKMNLNLS